MAGRERLIDYKRCGLRGVGKNRRQMADERRVLRENMRTRAMQERRGLILEESIDEKPVVSNRLLQLQTWKEKKKQMIAKDTGSKPAFIVGKIQYNDNYLYKPPESSTFKAPKGLKPMNLVTSQRILRSRAKPQGSSKPLKKALKDFATAMQSQTNLKMQTVNEEAGPSDNMRDDLNRTFDTESGLVMEEVQNVVPQCPNVSINSEANLKQVSEVVSQVSQNGNTTGRRSRRGKKGVKILNTPGEQKIESNVNQASQQISESSVVTDRDCPKSGDHFRSLLKEATEKLTALCTEWNTIKDEDIPVDVSDSIDVAVGYAKLLMSKKLLQFERLICEHENKTEGTELAVLSTDLDAFWNLVNIQVLNIYGKFEDLSVLKENNWVAEKVEVKKRNKTVPIPSKKARMPATSGMKSFIAQARKKALLRDKENTPQKSVLDILEGQQMGMIKPMSPVVMRIASMAKGIGSPLSKTPFQEHSTPQIRNNVEELYKTPLSSRKTPGRRTKRSLAAVDTPLRRSARICRLDPDQL